MANALNGIRVIDVTQVMAGPFCAMLLCDMGADVIKVEAPGGDATRGWGSPTGSESEAFNAVNRGKRGIVVNLKTDPGCDLVRRLLRDADVLIENYRPGVMDRFGLGYTAIATQHPRLIYASISGYGQTGPYRAQGGFDLVAQGASGIMSVTGEPERPPVKAGVPLTDLGAGLFAVSGILGALHHRYASGRGQHVDTSLFEAGVALSVWEATEYFSSGVAPRPFGSAHRLNAPYQAIRCADGYITIGAANDRLFARLAEVLGHAEWVDEPHFATNPARVEHHRVLAERIETITLESTRAHWLALFAGCGIPCGPINDYAAVAADPQTRAREMVIETDHPTLGRIKTLGTPVKLSETPLTPGRPAPRLGEHTDEVLTAAGYDADAIAKLRAEGVVA